MTAAQKILLALIPIAYLLGSVPFGLLVGLARGVDVRRAGSGNIGATNVGRLLGGKFFGLVFTLDLLKGLAPMIAAGVVLHFRIDDWRSSVLWLLAGFASILGHMFSLFLGFRGGKGVATSTGVILGLWPYYTLPGVVAVVVWGAMFKATRIVSISSIVGAIAFPIAYLVISLLAWHERIAAQWPLLAFAVLVAVLIVWKHKSNIVRLRAGTEPRFGPRVVSDGNGDGNGDGNAPRSNDDGPNGNGDRAVRG